MWRGGSARQRVVERRRAAIRLVLEAQVLSLNLFRWVADVLGSAIGLHDGRAMWGGEGGCAGHSGSVGSWWSLVKIRVWV